MIETVILPPLCALILWAGTTFTVINYVCSCGFHRSAVLHVGAVGTLQLANYQQ